MDHQAFITGPLGSTDLVLRLMKDQCRITESTLSRHFGFIPETVVLLQATKEEGDNMLIQVPSMVIDDAKFFLMDIAYGNKFSVEGTFSGGQLQLGKDTDILAQVGEEGNLKMDRIEKTTCLSNPSMVCGVENVRSALELLEALPSKNRLYQVFQQVKHTYYTLDEMPPIYDGDCLFELPCVEDKNSMSGMEAKFDGHAWTKYVTANIASFLGVVQKANCAGHLMC